jgi:SAM-dependent methyltransferase
MKHGDFTGLAEDYTKYRPDYAPSILRALTGLTGKPADKIDIADVGAGTGIWTRMMAGLNPQSIIAVEPNDDMRQQGKAHPDNGAISWLKGSGEETTLPSGSKDLLTMASSFHWVDFDKGTDEFIRALKPGGHFVALWNPRFIEANPLLVEIEDYAKKLKGADIKRVSSGRSDFTETLLSRLENCGKFSEVTYLESKHVIDFTPERYLGAWRSVNDMRVQLGAEKFSAFLDWVEDKISSVDTIEATYLTRAWAARKPL